MTSAGQWFRELALPLWIEAGWDRQSRSFVEGLDFAGRPLLDMPRRTMVQARQIWVMCVAARNGWHASAGSIADEALASLLSESDGTGYPFSKDRSGRVIDDRRDLYSHAFVLLALAEAYKLTGNRACLAAADQTLAFLDGAMATPETGGYKESLPLCDAPRRQNPHMHLFEALLALHEAAGGNGYLERAEKLHGLLSQHFLCGPQPVLAELFDDVWQPLTAADVIFEPGHHFEWVWLLDRFAQLSGQPDSAHPGRGLWDTAIANGVGEALWIYERVTASGTVVDASSRLWTYAEAAKAANSPLIGNPADNRARDFLHALNARFVIDGTGLWADRRNPDGSSPSSFVPASSLYHICGAVCAVE
ncbi:AGE family epimerase/isomerase [Cohaesibacter haloalkalitolerans]|uniref:AGE family epimerase/isomerase n=1 Tax=Cohaesibacter haloalkalitolerans TaxID=1162980 RepID=UPI000E659659|nr:AGE family epimerase/isomerase [Cohaesibacter haloalkalitolerans]